MLLVCKKFKTRYSGTNTRVTSLEEDVSTQDAVIEMPETSMLALEESVDDVEEGITALQVVNNDILDRKQF